MHKHPLSANPTSPGGSNDVPGRRGRRQTPRVFCLRRAASLPKTQAAPPTYRAQHSCLALPAAPLTVLCSALEAAACVAGPRYRFQTVAPATVFVRRLNQPRCVTQPSAEQRIRPAPRISHAYQNKRRRPTDARRAALDQAAPTKKKTSGVRRPCRRHS